MAVYARCEFRMMSLEIRLLKECHAQRASVEENILIQSHFQKQNSNLTEEKVQKITGTF